MPTTAQLTALKADLAANAATVAINGMATAINAVPHGTANAQAVADWYNLPAAPAFTVWRTDVSKDEVNGAVDWTEVVALATNPLLAFQLLKDQSKVNASQASIRAAFGAIFPAATKPNSNAGLLAVARRSATNAEKLFATGTGTTGSPATMGFEGALTAQDVLNAWSA